MTNTPRIPAAVIDGKRVSPSAAWQPALGVALDAYQAAVVRLQGLDPVTTELVRLKCARYHDCHT